MAADIAPELIATIQADIEKLVNEDKRIQKIIEKVAQNKATYEEAIRFARQYGNITAKVFKIRISSSILPDGKMYYNIAERLLNETLSKNCGIVNEICRQVQNIMNKEQGLGIKAKVPELNQDRIDGLITKVSDADVYDDVAWVLDEPVVNLHQSVVDDFVEENVKFHSSLGLKPEVTRISEAKCCKWCSSLAGTYIYPDVPREVFQRHENCRCEVTYSGNRLGAYKGKSGKANTFR